MKKTTLRQNVTNTDRQWFLVDADGITLGKLAVRIADVLRGKNKPSYTPHVDGGNYVVVLNAEKIMVSGRKEEGKKYYRHSRRLGELKSQTLREVRAKRPTRILEEAVSGMLPSTKLRASQMKRLKLVIGSENPYEAQKPQPLSLT
ncbi:50S ribosomal protein L13 [Candidatus Gracilibacteria bacterium]|nr:50S ribosomal protein L13 [Candidatus Gracilibacteria bacterium]